MTTVIEKPDRRKRIRNMQDISLETFDKMTPEVQARVTFELQKATYDKLDTQIPICNERFGKIETKQTKWKIALGSVAAGGGVIGWAIGAFDKFAFWK